MPEISVENIVDLHSSGNLPRLATFIGFKQLYSNSCVFDYNIKSLSRKSGLSRHKVRVNVNWFIENGWCYIHRGNLIFKKHENKGINWIIRDRKQYIGKTIKEIEVILLSHVLKGKISQNSYIQKIKQDLQKSIGSAFVSLKGYKRAIKAEQKYGIKPGEIADLRMTMGNIGEMFGCSKSKAGNLVASMERMRLIRVRRFVPSFLGYSGKFGNSLSGLRGVFVMGRGYVYSKKCNEYCFF